MPLSYPLEMGNSYIRNSRIFVDVVRIGQLLVVDLQELDGALGVDGPGRIGALGRLPPAPRVHILPLTRDFLLVVLDILDLKRRIVLFLQDLVLGASQSRIMACFDE